MTELSVPAGIVSANPTISIDGEPQPNLNLELLSALVEETTDGLARAEFRFSNWGTGDAATDYLHFSRDLLDFGKTITLTMGSDDGQAEVFTGRISGIEAQYSATIPPAIVILAEDRLMDLRKTRRSRTFEDMSDADIFGQIANEHGLSADIDLDGDTTHVLVAQLNQSDLAFLRERARRINAELWFTDGTLSAKSRGKRAGNADYTLVLGVGLMEFSVIADLANQHTSVIVSGWDVASKDRLSHEADASALGSELNGDTSGADILREAFGTRVDRIAHQFPMNAAETQTLAEAAFVAQARRFVTGIGMAKGDARLRVGARVEMQKLGALFDGMYTLVEVRHTFTRTVGYMTEFRVERPGIG